MAAACPCLAQAPAAPDDPAERARRFVAEAQQHPESLDAAGARQALAALDAAGEVDSVEGRWLIDRLLDANPGDTELLWLRARLRSAVGDVEGAIRDLEALVAAGPAPELRAAALRRLARAYEETGRAADEVRVDRVLLDEKLEDPVPVLIRMAKAYRRLGDIRSTREVIDRLLVVAPDELRFNADLVWIAAETSRRVDPPLVAGRRYLAFANLFPDDPRSVEALLEAARLAQTAGHLRGAALIATTAIDRGGEGRLAESARLLRAGIEERLEQHDAARRDYHAVVSRTLDPALAAEALRELVELSLSADGLEPTLRMLAGMASRGDGYSRTFATSHFARLMRVGEKELVRTDRDAAFWVTVAREIGNLDVLPATTRLRAARFFGSLGDTEQVVQIAGPLAATLGPDGDAARALLAEHDIDPPFGERRVPLARRAVALWRARDWNGLVELLDDATLAAHGSPRLRALRADAELRLGRPDAALRVLGRNPASASERLLRGDAASMRGDWKTACASYRSAAGDDLSAVERAWCEVRLAECAHRDGDTERSRERIARWIAAPEPVGPACAATVLGIAWGLAPGGGVRR
ncbi:MAG: hypothetical protein Kow0062_23020 [Acidobacteriota bacterium]